MFHHRRTSQKPDEELYAAFKQNFPGVGPGTSSATSGSLQRSTSLSEALIDAPVQHRPFGDLDDLKDHDVTPKGLHDPWRLTPSLMDPNSFAFTAFANQPPGYYTPTPGGINTLYQSAAGDLHTPGMGMNTPLSMPHSIQGLAAHQGSMDLQHFQPHLLQAQHFHQPYPQQPSYAPSRFLQHQDSGYVAMDNSPHKTTPNPSDLVMAPPSNAQSLHGLAQQPLPVGERFRFHVTLNAPTAMVRHADEIPITYLNKGQAYTLSVTDYAPPPPTPSPIKYRTYVRVSFEDEQQRARPANCWQLWKEGRGMNEAHQRGGKLLAVEYVDPSQGGDDESRKSPVQLESASFDGFCVTWTPNPATGTLDTSISVRFNFLSTDFSHSKGVKGIPVRLCAKTEMLLPADQPSHSGEAEVCFSKVKLFRDHGAERKLSNDVAHVKKTIDKLKQQISQAEAGLGNPGKRKRTGSIAKNAVSRPGKIVKHKRTWSMDDSEADLTGRLSAEEDLHMKLASMQDMFSSTRPASVLYLRGDPEDDPDEYPVQLPSSSDAPELKPLTRTTTWETKQSTTDSPATSEAASDTPSPTTQTTHTTPKRKLSAYQGGTVGESSTSVGRSDAPPGVATPISPLMPVKVAKREPDSTPRGSLLAVDIDSSYQPPSEPRNKPVACFYVRSSKGGNEYHRAVYLMQRTVRDLVNGISVKFGIDPHQVTQVTHINSRGLQIVVDEDVVRELPEGQDMVVDFAPAPADTAVKSEFLVPTATEMLMGGDFGPDMNISDPLEMWLNY